MVPTNVLLTTGIMTTIYVGYQFHGTTIMSTITSDKDIMMNLCFQLNFQAEMLQGGKHDKCIQPHASFLHQFKWSRR